MQINHAIFEPQQIAILTWKWKISAIFSDFVGPYPFWAFFMNGTVFANGAHQTPFFTWTQIGIINLQEPLWLRKNSKAIRDGQPKKNFKFTLFWHLANYHPSHLAEKFSWYCHENANVESGLRQWKREKAFLKPFAKNNSYELKYKFAKSSLWMFWKYLQWMYLDIS